jgi:putative lipoic acid-binding regulatory protein
MAGRDRDLIEFPTQFSIKAFGEDEEGFAELVLAIVQKHAPEVGQEALTRRSSRGGKYLAVTVTLTAETRQQLEAIYQELNDHPRVIMLL